MKLGEALKLRSDTYKKIEELRSRAAASALVQEGTKAPDDPNALIEQIERMSLDAMKIVQRINRTNVQTHLASGELMVNALAERDYLLALRGQLESVARAGVEIQARYLRSELRVIDNVRPAEVRKRTDELARRHRLLDNEIQAANWTTELID